MVSECLCERRKMWTHFSLIASKHHRLLFIMGLFTVYTLLICSHAQILGTLQAYQHWLSELYLSSLRHQQPSQGISLLVSAVVEATIPVISQEIPEKVALSASRLLLSLASTVRPCFLARIPAIRGLLDKAASGQLKGLPLKVHSMTCEALTAMLVLPWPSLSEQVA